AGLAVSLAMVPEAVSFSFVAGVSPLVGLWTTVVLGFFAALFGGRAGICSSASGACSVVVAALCASHGGGYLAGCAALAGILQIVAGTAGMGKLIRIVPHPVMIGFVNGLTLVMLKAQMTHFKTAGKFMSLFTAEGKATYGCAILTMFLVRFGLPKLQKKVEAAKAVPPTLGGVVLAAIVAKYLKWPVKTLADVAGSETFRGGLSILPKIGLPSSVWEPLMNAPVETLRVILPYAITMAAVGSIESLLTLQLLDGLVDDGKRGSTKREVIGQGIGNLASGLTGGIGGCALIGQSLINAQSGGGVSRFSGMSMAIFLALGIVSFAPLLGQIPVVALAGVMLLVCQSTFSWGSLRLFGKIPNIDMFTILLTTYVTVKDDLAKAVLLGTISSALGFAWKQSTTISAQITHTNLNVPGGGPRLPNVKSYNIHGPLFFGSSQAFSGLFRVKEDPDDIVIDFTSSRVFDHSALDAINALANRYGALGKRVYLRHLSSDCAKLLEKIHDGGLPPFEVVESDPSTDPVYGVAEDS
ncbi:sulfate transporter, partial [Thalassiosira pseudonana CCMP1335]